MKPDPDVILIRFYFFGAMIKNGLKATAFKKKSDFSFLGNPN